MAGVVQAVAGGRVWSRGGAVWPGWTRGGAGDRGAAARAGVRGAAWLG
ncbi:hypothetical protein [Lentzea cavernae]|nr:hypothetical protein [Lentzea cavernae]